MEGACEAAVGLGWFEHYLLEHDFDCLAAIWRGSRDRYRFSGAAVDWRPRLRLDYWRLDSRSLVRAGWDLLDHFAGRALPLTDPEPRERRDLWLMRRLCRHCRLSRHGPPQLIRRRI